MNAKNQTTRDRRARGAARGFTLTELLAVISILGLLMGMLVPSLHEVVTLAQRKAGCGNNLSAIIKAANQYALADSKNRLPSITPAPTPTNWGSMTVGNPACLWLLVAERQCDRNAFLCPEAGSSRQWQAPALDATAFKYDKTLAISTLSYSFISMIRFKDWPEKLADKMSMATVPGTLVVLADKNPRCTFGTQDMKTYAQLDQAAGGKLGLKARNTLNHRRKGQSYARWDAAVFWVTDPNDQNGNDIYTSAVKVAADEKKGRRAEMIDPFLLP